MPGALDGLRILEVSGLGPAPFAAMMLADHGAEVLRLERADRVGNGEPNPDARFDPLGRNRRCVGVDLKHPDGAGLVRRLTTHADGFIEPFRPGVAERLGLGPDVLHAVNPHLVYGRMTGWGQDGPWADEAGHDINYLSITGALHAIGPPARPAVPLNLVADFGGGGLLLAFGMVIALLHAQRTGEGQVVDAAMVDGVAAQMAAVSGMEAMGIWRDEREANFLDGGAPFYTTYECADGRHVAVGAIEPQFYASLLERLGLTGEELPDQNDPDGWPEMRRRFEAVFARRTRDEWADHVAGHPCCVTPVLSIAESRRHPHHRARGTWTDVDGAPQPAPAPRLSATTGAVHRSAASPGEHTTAALADWGVDEQEVDRLRTLGAVG